MNPDIEYVEGHDYSVFGVITIAQGAPCRFWDMCNIDCNCKKIKYLHNVNSLGLDVQCGWDEDGRMVWKHSKMCKLCKEELSNETEYRVLKFTEETL